MNKRSDLMQNAEDYLGQIRIIDRRINAELSRLHDMKLGAMSTGAIDYSKDRVQTSPKNTLELTVCRYVELEQRIDELIDILIDARYKMVYQIRQIDREEYVQILILIYVQLKSLRTASREMNVSYDDAIGLRESALAEFAALNTDYRDFVAECEYIE